MAGLLDKQLEREIILFEIIFIFNEKVLIVNWIWDFKSQISILIFGSRSEFRKEKQHVFNHRKWDFRQYSSLCCMDISESFHLD